MKTSTGLAATIALGLLIAACGTDQAGDPTAKVDSPPTELNEDAGAGQPDAADTSPSETSNGEADPEPTDGLAFADLSADEQDGTDYLCRIAHGDDSADMQQLALLSVRAGERAVPSAMYELVEQADDDLEAAMAAIDEACSDMEWPGT